MFDVFNKRQMYDSGITGKEDASKDRNCIMSMFLTSFNACFMFLYACFMCRVWTTITTWLLWVKTGWQSGQSDTFIDSLICSVAKV